VEGTSPESATASSFDDFVAATAPRDRAQQLRGHRARNVLRLKPRDLDAAVDNPSDDFAARVADQRLAQRARVEDAMMNLRSRSSQRGTASGSATCPSRQQPGGGEDGLRRFKPPDSGAAADPAVEERRASSWYNSFAPGLNSSTSPGWAAPNGPGSSLPPLAASLPAAAAMPGSNTTFPSPNKMRSTPTVTASSLRVSSQGHSRSTRAGSHADRGSGAASPRIKMDASGAAADEDTYRAQSVFDFPSRALSAGTAV